MQEDRFRDQLNSSSDEPDSVSQVVTLDEATSGNEETFEPLQQQKSHPRITYVIKNRRFNIRGSCQVDGESGRNEVERTSTINVKADR